MHSYVKKNKPSYKKFFTKRVESIKISAPCALFDLSIYLLDLGITIEPPVISVVGSASSPASM